MALTALSLSLIAGSVMMTQPESRGFFVVLAAAVGVGLWALRSKAGAPRIGPLHSDTEAAPRPQPRAAAPAGYTVRQAPQPAHANVKAQAAQPGARSARVRRIMAMEEIGYGD